MTSVPCRFCATPLTHTFVDLGSSPLANSYLKPEHLSDKEAFYPLHVYVCHTCFLVQLGEMASPQTIFRDYAYFSSFSESWLAHCQAYASHMISTLGLTGKSHVLEIASNDGYLLQYFQEKNIPVLGIEPALNVARAAQQKGIETRAEFFGVSLAEKLKEEGKEADLLIANNVLAHVPDLRDFVAGIPRVLKPEGLVTVEFPHLLQLVRFKQFDTIYHEHFSYFSLTTVQKIFQTFGLKIIHVDKIPTHGGSLRLYACHEEAQSHPLSPQVQDFLQEEEQAGMTHLSFYQNFQKEVEKIRENFQEFLFQAKKEGKKVAAYGAPAKGNTLLNYCHIGPDLISWTVDKSPHKQGTLLPGVHISVENPEMILQEKPDYLVILPWNLKDEIIEQQKIIRDWGGKFVIPLPQVEVME